MQKLIELKQRMKTVENIAAIARTMATVSAAKLSRTRHRAAGLREYTQKIREVLYDQQEYLALTGSTFGDFSPLLQEKEPADKVILILITSDRGMCGNYNLAAQRLALSFWEERKKNGQEVKFIVKGRKGAAYFKKRGADIIYKENWRREGVLVEEVEHLLAFLIDLYLAKKADQIHCVYTQFYSPIKRKPRIIRILPVEIKLPEKQSPEKIDKWHYEPSFREIIEELLTIYLRVQFYDVLMESYASEQGARMLTMEEATERAERTLRDCQVLYHRLRREVITTELLGVLFASKVTEETSLAPGRLA